jgi:hypothetical protein
MVHLCCPLGSALLNLCLGYSKTVRRFIVQRTTRIEAVMESNRRFVALCLILDEEPDN